MAALLTAMAVMAILMSAALPAWRTAAQREKEAELIFRGEQYARAISLYQRRYGNASPPNLDTLINERFLRKKYRDPITNDDFQLLTAGQTAPGFQQTQAPTGANPSAGRGGGVDLTPSGRQQGAGPMAVNQAAGRGGIIGVMSKSAERSFRLYNGRDTYNQWVFMGVQQSVTAGAGAGRGADGRGGRGGQDGRGAQSGRGFDGRGGLDGRGGFDGRGGQGVPGRGQQPTAPGRGGPVIR